jgi:hypothetical protein
MATKANKNKYWFKPLRKSYIAANYKGALSYLPYIAYLTISFIVPLHYLKSKLVAFGLVIINWSLATLVMTAFAKSKSS